MATSATLEPGFLRMKASISAACVSRAVGFALVAPPEAGFLAAVPAVVRFPETGFFAAGVLAAGFFAAGFFAAGFFAAASFLAFSYSFSSRSFSSPRAFSMRLRVLRTDF